MSIQYYELQVLLYWWDNDHSDKKLNNHICQGSSVSNVHTQCHFQQTTSYSKSSQRGARMTEWDYCPPLPPVIYTCRKKFYEERTETSKEKKKGFKINAKIEDIGLNED